MVLPSRSPLFMYSRVGTTKIALTIILAWSFGSGCWLGGLEPLSRLFQGVEHGPHDSSWDGGHIGGVSPRLCHNLSHLKEVRSNEEAQGIPQASC